MNYSALIPIMTSAWFLCLVHRAALLAQSYSGASFSGLMLAHEAGIILMMGAGFVLSWLQLRRPKKPLAMAMLVICLLLLNKLFVYSVLQSLRAEHFFQSFEIFQQAVWRTRHGTLAGLPALALIVTSLVVYPWRVIRAEASHPPSLPALHTDQNGNPKLAKVIFGWSLVSWFLAALSIGVALLTGLLTKNHSPGSTGAIAGGLILLTACVCSIVSLAMYGAFRKTARLDPTLHDNGMARGGAIISGIFLAMMLAFILLRLVTGNLQQKASIPPPPAGRQPMKQPGHK